jgi:opacity protein-like surface antigen
MKNVVKGLVIASLVGSSGAYADNMYISVSGGIGKIPTISSNRDFPLVLKSPVFSNADISSINLSFKNSKNLNTAIGYQFGGVRTEAAINLISANYRKFHHNAYYFIMTDYLSGKVKTNSFFINGYYDFDFNKTVTPYLGVGVGVSKIKNTLYHSGMHDYINGVYSPLPVFEANMTQTLPAYQLIAGTKINLTGQLALTADYRFLGTIKEMKALNGRLRNHSINLGLTFGF